MGTLYTLQLEKQEGETTVLNDITIGDRSIQFRFQWAVASEEQYQILVHFIDTKAHSDPLEIDGAYTYSYDYMDYYLTLAEKTEQELNDWLDTDPVLPVSIKRAERSAQLLMLSSRIQECVLLQPVMAQYKEVLRWQFHALYEDEINVGFIEPGGWYRSQDAALQFRFVSPLPYIGKEDFNQVTLEFEVGND